MNLRAVAIGGANNPSTLIVGDGGTALTLPAAGPPLVNHTLMSGTVANLYAIAQNPNLTRDDLLIGGAPIVTKAVAESWDGNGAFSAQMTGMVGITGNIYALLCGTGTFFAAGDMGAIVSRTSGGGAPGGANKWATETSTVNTTLRAMWATADNNIYAVGDGGTIIQYNGSSWAKVPITPPPPAISLRAIWGSSATNIYVVGDSGYVLHYLP